MILSCSMIEPGHPCVTITGSAFGCFERTWMKWMSRPSISVPKCGRAFSLASHLRQSCSLAQWRASFCIVANCTPCEVSATVSASGQTVAAMRRCSSSRLALDATGTVKGRIEGLVMAAFAWLGGYTNRLAESAASEPRKPRRVVNVERGDFLRGMSGSLYVDQSHQLDGMASIGRWYCPAIGKQRDNAG